MQKTGQFFTPTHDFLELIFYPFPPFYWRIKMKFAMKTLLITIATAGIAGTASAAIVSSPGLVVTDHPQAPASANDAFFNSLTDVVAGNPSGNNRYSLDAGDIEGQSFTLDSALVLDSIYVGYNDQQSTGSFNLRINVGNDATIDHTFTVTLGAIGDLQTGGGNSGPFHYVQFDVSSENIALGAGVHSFSLEGVTDNGEGSFLFAPLISGSDSYVGGQLLSNSGRDSTFAVTAVPEPGSLALLGLGGLLIARRRHNA